MVTLAGAFARAGHPVDLVLARALGPYLDEVPAAVKVVDLASPLVRVPPIRGRRRHWGPASTLALARYLRTTRPAALLSTWTYNNLAALWARRLSGTDTRVVVRETIHVSAYATGDKRRPWLPGMLRRAYRTADAVVAVSQGVADDLARVTGLSPERIATITNPLPIDEIERRAREPLDHPWFAPGAPPALVAVGRLVAQKDHATLLRAFARVRRGRPLRLVILGEGSLRSELLLLARNLGVTDDVAFPGFAENPPAYLARAAAFVLSSAYEGLPNALLEALACGCPAVSTDCPSGPAEILEGGRHGPLVPVGDAAALADAIATVLDNPPDSAALRQRARAFNVDASAERFLRVLLGARDAAARRDSHSPSNSPPRV